MLTSASASAYDRNDRVARGDVGDRDPVRHLGGGSALRHRELARERRGAEDAKIDVDHDVTEHPGLPRDRLSGGDLDAMTLSVTKAERDDLEPFAPRDSQHGR